MSTTGSFVSGLGFLPVRARLYVRDLLIASWEADREAVARVAPLGAEPAEIAGRHLVSVVTFRVGGGRLGLLPILPFAQLNVRTYVAWEEEPAVLFLAARVTPGGYGGVLLGAPYKLARLRVRTGEVRAPGLGFALRYRPAKPGDPGDLGRHELGIFESRGIRSFRIERGEAEWRSAELLEPARADLLLGYGFKPRGQPELLYAARASFEASRPS
jgi:Uncharacterized conserved protein (COG2071)